jgi:hypothetical protein
MLLFAIVLGLAAVVTALSRTPPDRPDRAPRVAPSRPSAGPGPGPGPARSVRFDAGHAPKTERLSVGQAASVSVRVDEPGTVALGGLGLTATAEPLTPARFDVLLSEPGEHPVRLAPANGADERTVGRLIVRDRP